MKQKDLEEIKTVVSDVVYDNVRQIVEEEFPEDPPKTPWYETWRVAFAIIPLCVFLASIIILGLPKTVEGIWNGGKAAVNYWHCDHGKRKITVNVITRNGVSFHEKINQLEVDEDSTLNLVVDLESGLVTAGKSVEGNYYELHYGTTKEDTTQHWKPHWKPFEKVK